MGYPTDSKAVVNAVGKNLSKSLSPVYAPIYQRIGAFIIDLIIIYGTAISFCLGFQILNDWSWIMLSAAFVSSIYLTFFYYKGKGQTIGGKVFGIKVTSTTGPELGFWRALLRSVLISAIISPLGLVAILGVSFLLFSLLSLNLKPTKQKRQTFWDAATKTCVIKGGLKLKWNQW
jgi:uncharacterized RDD family membrane protein YckC